MLVLIFAACSNKTAPKNPETTTATLTGSVDVVSGTPCPEPGPGCAGWNGDYEVVVYAEDGTTVAGTTKTAADGTFSIALPPGKYVILTPAGPGVPPKRNEVELGANVAPVKLVVDTGVR